MSGVKINTVKVDATIVSCKDRDTKHIKGGIEVYVPFTHSEVSSLQPDVTDPCFKYTIMYGTFKTC